MLVNDITKSVTELTENPVFAFREKNCKLSQAYSLAAKRFERGIGIRNLRRDIIQLNPVCSVHKVYLVVIRGKTEAKVNFPDSNFLDFSFRTTNLMHLILSLMGFTPLTRFQVLRETKRKYLPRKC